MTHNAFIVEAPQDRQSRRIGSPQFRSNLRAVARCIMAAA